MINNTAANTCDKKSKMKLLEKKFQLPNLVSDIASLVKYFYKILTEVFKKIAFFTARKSPVSGYISKK
jgi:hypothetical protein